MLRGKLMSLVTLLVALVVLVAGCQPETIVETVIITEEGETIVVTATPAPDGVDVQPVEGPVVGGPGDTYRIAVLSDMSTTNIWSAYDPDASIWNYAVYISKYPTAYSLTEHRWDFIPWLAVDFATELEEEGDFWVSTVPLAEGALWSDGTEITAEDWAWTAETVMALGLSGNWSSNGYDSAYLDRIEAVDAYTAKLYYHTKPGLARHEYGTLQAPILSRAFWADRVAPLLERMEGIADLDPDSDDYIAAQEEILQALYQLDGTGEPTGGPWNLSQWEPGAFSEISRHDAFFRRGTEVTEFAEGAYREVRPDGVEIVAHGDPTGEVETEYVEGPWFENTLFSVYNADAALLALDAGEVDFVLTPNGLSRGQVEQISQNPNISFVANPANGFRYLGFNFDVEPLNDPAIRQAIACQIDKQFLTQNLLQGAAIPVNTLVPESNTYWHNPDVPLYCDGMTTEERLVEATRILEEAGYTWDVAPTWNTDRGGSAEWGVGMRAPDGTPVPQLSLLAPSAGYDPLRATAGVYIEQWINQLGIPTTANLTNFNNILDTVFGSRDWDMYILGWGVTAYPSYICDFFTDAGWNETRYSYYAPEFQGMCDDFYAETDVELAREKGLAIQAHLSENLPYITLFTTPMYDAWRSDSVTFPFTELIDGLGAGYYGLKTHVQAVQ